MNREVTINSRKFDGEIHRSWRARLVQETDSLFVFVGTFEKKVIHPHLGIIRRGTVSYEYYWKDDWFNVFRFHEPVGSLRNFYCNINQPPKYQNGVLDYIDLDIDVLVWKDFTYQILDLEEFEENARKFQYSELLREKTAQTLKKILFLIENRLFPFGRAES